MGLVWDKDRRCRYFGAHYPRHMERSLTKMGWAEPTKEDAQTRQDTSTTWKTRYCLDSLGTKQIVITQLIQ